MFQLAATLDTNRDSEAWPLRRAGRIGGLDHVLAVRLSSELLPQPGPVLGCEVAMLDVDMTGSRGGVSPCARAVRRHSGPDPYLS